MNFLTNFIKKNLTILRGNAGISKIREVSIEPNREVKAEKLIMESFSCPYCSSKNFQKRGFRQKKLEKIQLYLCLTCNKTFTPYSTRGKHYPLSTMFDAISIYNLGYSLEQTCRIVNERQQKTRLSASSLTIYEPNVVAPDLSKKHDNITDIKSQGVKIGVDPTGVAPVQPDSTDPVRHWSGPTPNSVYSFMIQPSTLSNWLEETKELCRFSRMREFALKKYSPKDMVIHATLAHPVTSSAKNTGLFLKSQRTCNGVNRFNELKITKASQI